LALVERGPRGLVLAAANPAAQARGVRRGHTHADARAMLPSLKSAPADAEAAGRALGRLALWCERYSPLVAVDGARPGHEGLFLDMTGGAHLFGGDAAMLAGLVQRLAGADIPAQAAIADTPGAAWALARFGGHGARIAPPGRSREALAPLPVEALRLEEGAVRLLGKFGLKRIGDLYPLPRAGLARRFRGEEGLEVVRRLDQALGGGAEALQSVRSAPLYRAWQAFAEPLLDVAGVEHVLPDLVQALAVQLDKGGVGARSVSLTAFRTDGRTTVIAARLSAAGRSPEHILRLLKETGLEKLDLGFGADALMLCAHRTETIGARQADIEPDAAAAETDALADLIDRLSARLGEGTVRRPQAVESWLPERSERWVPAGPAAPEAPAAPPRLRPLLLLDPPEPVEALAELPDSAPVRFTWRRVHHKVARAEGPERLCPEWGRPVKGLMEPRTRDYYAVEDEAGRRFWLFREGLYDRLEAGDEEPAEGGETPRRREPAWWMHGVFA
jgi:protein ImuB